MLSVSSSESGRWRILHVRGEIDMATCPILRQEIVGEIGQGHRHLVVDLAGVDFVDSTGLGVLIGGLKRARSQGGDLRVSGVSGHLRRIFDLTGLHRVFAVVELDRPDEVVEARSGSNQP